MTYQPRVALVGPGLSRRRFGIVSGPSLALDGSGVGAWFARPEAERRDLARTASLHRMAELALAPNRGNPIARRALRVPSEAFVPVDARLLPAAARPLLSGPGAIANDNAPPLGKGRLGKALREAIFIVVLAATLYGAFYTGRQHASQKVIVVPGPIGFSSAVT